MQNLAWKQRGEVVNLKCRLGRNNERCGKQRWVACSHFDCVKPPYCSRSWGRPPAAPAPAVVRQMRIRVLLLNP